jgi:uncharacterized RDD family membrane protein YckC
MGMRLLGRILDWILVGFVSGIAAYAAGIHAFHTSSSDGNHSASFSLLGADYFKFLLIVLVVGGGYEVTMLVTKGATLGKMAVGVRVARLADGTNPDVGSAVIRWLIPGIAGLIPFAQLITFLSPFFDSTHRNRGWYDYAAKTIAVRSR